MFCYVLLCFANVWLSYDTINNIFVAIKVQHPDNYDEGIDELKFLMRLNKYNNPYINNVLDGFIDVRKDKEGKKKYVCMVFELLAGNLYDVIKEGKYSNGLPLNIIKNITKQLLLSIKLINKKMDAIHGDIKPENILIEGVNKNCELIIEEYKKLDFKSEFTKRKNEFLKAKGISSNNKAKIKKAFNKKIKSKIRKIIHSEFMNKLQIYIDDSSEDDDSSYYSESENEEEELANYSNEDNENNQEKENNDDQLNKENNEEQLEESDEEVDNSPDLVEVKRRMTNLKRQFNKTCKVLEAKGRIAKRAKEEFFKLGQIFKFLKFSPKMFEDLEKT
jgi:hypothetical protein